MLNVRKLKQDFSHNILKEGKLLFDQKRVLSAQIISLSDSSIRIAAKILGQYDNQYESEIEIDRHACETIDSDCDCSYRYDCQHIAALLFFLEEHLDEMIVAYARGKEEHLEESIGDKLLEIVKEAASKEEMRQGVQFQKEVLEEYAIASKILAESPFFLPVEEKAVDSAELAILFNVLDQEAGRPIVEMQFCLRLPSRSKPLYVANVKDFIEGIRHEEPLLLGGKRYFFSLLSFPEPHREMIRMIVDYARFHEKAITEKGLRSAYIEMKTFGLILAESHRLALEEIQVKRASFSKNEWPTLPCIYHETLEEPLSFSVSPISFAMGIEYIDPPASKVLLNPVLSIDEQLVSLEEVRLFECAFPGLIYKDMYYRFNPEIRRAHLQHLNKLRMMTIPHPLLGTFIEQALPELVKFAPILQEKGKQFAPTLPFVGTLKGVCTLSYLDGELEADLLFDYGSFQVPSSTTQLSYEQASRFVSEEGIVARDLVAESKVIRELFEGFNLVEETGHFSSKSDKKIVEFMTEVLPKHQDRISFHCPQNLLDQFIYDETHFSLHFSHLDRIDIYEIVLQVNGDLTGVRIDRIWECVLSKRPFIELENPKVSSKRISDRSKALPKILVLQLEKMQRLVQLFDELGIEKLENHVLTCPLWSLANIDASQFEDLPVSISMTEQLVEIRKQMLGQKTLSCLPVPAEIRAELRSYQVEGVHWLERIRKMYLAGILADDMGLGKTLQAIVAITQQRQEQGGMAMIVCPTSLLYNWVEEIGRFNPELKSIVIDGAPLQRKKMIRALENYDVVITSYSLLQKDVELYADLRFSYVVLDEAQHIKNRTTRNAKSVKQLKGDHRLILSGTPIENALEELWSLFDFLMPRFLGSYDRFVERYIRPTGEELSANLAYLRAKVAPFILRRMKADVLKDLPPVTEIVYHCQLTPYQNELYRSYAASARDELIRLVEKEGFDKVQIHVLATLTRLKQICCHPAIFAKEHPEIGDSAKYDLLMDLLRTLIEGGHKIVLFSQYTKMLQIIRSDLEKEAIRHLYLDGSSKNRMELVHQFNGDPHLPIFLVSLKAGGTGLNLTAADTVIHFDMWWNPAVQSQATDRVHRLGQDKNVSVYKLITKNTIEEKIVEMQNSKKNLVKKVVACDEDAITKLTWEDVLELLET